MRRECFLGLLMDASSGLVAWVSERDLCWLRPG